MLQQFRTLDGDILIRVPDTRIAAKNDMVRPQNIHDDEL